MIKPHCFTPDWLDSFKQQKSHQRIDKRILEKMIYALHLLERLHANGLEFVFKGGTCLVILMEEANRFSIDIDIICNLDRRSLEAILEKVVQTSNFNVFELDHRRSYQSGIPKAHYAFSFDSSYEAQYSGTILLDILIEGSIYPALTQKPIQTKWIETENETLITVPTIDSIVGDKLTAFAPNTIGIPYFKGSNQQSFAMEICKQLFDLGRLFEKITDFETVFDSFQLFAKQEIQYRKRRNAFGNLEPEDVAQDTLDTCLILAKRGKGTEDEKVKFVELQKGIRAFGSGFLMQGNFRIDEAIATSARIAYLAAKILRKDFGPILFFRQQDVQSLYIEDPNWNYLNKLKKLPDKSCYFYWYQAVQLINAVNLQPTF